MNEHVYIVLWRLNGGKWNYAGMAESVQDRDLLMGAIRLDHHFDGFEYAYVEGPLTNVTEMEATEAALGDFNAPAGSLAAVAPGFGSLAAVAPGFATP